jgi:hypothetical protein
MGKDSGKSGQHAHTRYEYKRGQIETFGLAFIVVLIVIGFFLYVSFKSHQTPENPQKDFTNNKLASDFVLSIINVNVQDCAGFTVENLIIDCARDHRIKCGAMSDIDSCTAVNQSINTMLNKTFMTRKTKFRFYSENLYDSAGKDLINIVYLNCTAKSSQGQQGVAVLRLYPAPGEVYLNMNLCI